VSILKEEVAITSHTLRHIKDASPDALPTLSRRLRLKCDDTLAETRFRLWAKRTSQFSRSVRISGSRARSKRDGTRAETRFGLSAKRTSPFKSAWGSVQSAAGSRCVRISGSNAG